jgi:hypothetical protein
MFCKPYGLGEGGLHTPLSLFFATLSTGRILTIMIYSYHRPSGATKLGARLRLAVQFPRDNNWVIRPKRDRKPDINWGCGSFGFGTAISDNTLNRNILSAVSKIETFKKLGEAGLPVPRWSTTLEELKKQLVEGRAIIARKDGLSGGRCMVLVGEPQNFQTDFYVERLSCRREFRIHCFQGSAIHRQAKFVPHGFEGIARNWENGCYFTSEDLDRFANEAELRDLESLALKSVETLGLDFGAVDLLITKRGKPYVLEVNTAPGLRSEATYNAYEGALKKLYNLQ